MVKIAEDDIDLDLIRSDPRFQDMMAGAKARLGLA